MYYQKPSTNLLRMIISIRNTLEEIENAKLTSFKECRRLELLEKSSTLFLDQKISYK